MLLLGLKRVAAISVPDGKNNWIVLSLIVCDLEKKSTFLFHVQGQNNWIKMKLIWLCSSKLIVIISTIDGNIHSNSNSKNSF